MGFCRGRHLPRGRRQPSWADQSVPVEFRSHSWSIDPFEDVEFDEEGYIVERERRQAFDHIESIARHLFAVQHRIFLFMFHVIGRRVRLLRWDRAGVVTTPSIDYYELSTVFCDLFWRLSRLDDVALGLDPSATRLSPRNVDYLRMDAAAIPCDDDVDHNGGTLPDIQSHHTPVFEYVRSLFRSSLAEDWPRHKLVVPHITGMREYLVGKPVFISRVMFGRGTRGYVALDCTTDRFVWLKDTWRMSYLFEDREGDILERLNTAGIDNVPTLVSHGDVSDQVTVASDWSGRPRPDPSCALTLSSTTSTPPESRKRKRETESDGQRPDNIGRHQSSDTTLCSDGPLPQHQHYRIVVAEVCISLRQLKNSRQLVEVTRDCLRGESQKTTWGRSLC